MIGVSNYVQFAAPIMHRLSSLNLAWQWQAGCKHMHLRNHSGIVCSSGLLSRLFALVTKKNLVLLLACDVWVIRCTALLCRAILRPFKYGCSHVDNRCGHVSLSLLWYNAHLGFRCVRGPKYVLLVVTHVLGIYKF